MRNPPPPGLWDSTVSLAALALFTLGLGVARHEWQSLLAGVVCAALAAGGWSIHRWWRNRFDEWHPYGVDLAALDRDGSGTDVETILEAARRARSPQLVAEANSLADALSTGGGPPSQMSPEMAAAWDERREVERLTASQLAAVTMGAIPEESWCDDLERRMLATPNWPGYWPERARIVHRSMQLLRSVTPH